MFKRSILTLSAVTTFAFAGIASAQPHGGPRSLDQDGDGAVTLEEFEAPALARFGKEDANDDGTVTPEERKAAFEAHIKEMQARGEEPRHHGPRGPEGKHARPEGKRPEGKNFRNQPLTKAELTAKIAEHFEKLDSNADGELSQDELLAGFQRGPRGQH